MFRSAINRGREIGILACNTGNMDDMLRSATGAVVQEVRDSQLRRADRVSDVNIDQRISAARGRVSTFRRVRRSPEVAPVLYAMQA